MEAIHIGDHLQELLDARGMAESEFIHTMGLSEDIGRNLLYGKERVTEDIARRLEEIFNVSQSFWLGLQKLYER